MFYWSKTLGHFSIFLTLKGNIIASIKLQDIYFSLKSPEIRYQENLYKLFGAKRTTANRPNIIEDNGPVPQLLAVSSIDCHGYPGQTFHFLGYRVNQLNWLVAFTYKTRTL